MSYHLDSVEGYDVFKRKLRRLVEIDRVPQALLFTGTESVPMRELTTAFAQMILNTDNIEHPDLHIYSPEGKVGLHTISTMRKFTSDVYLAPFDSHKKVFIILEAERMLPTSANALLKTFEEPAPGSVIILVSCRPSSMLPTILSRCQKIQVDSEAPNIPSEDLLHKQLLTAASSGILSSYAKVLELVDQISAQIDTECQDLEKSLRSSLIEERANQLTATQKETLTKEIDGNVSLQKKARVKELLISLQSWFRDIHLLKFNGNSEYLMNPQFHDELVTATKLKVIPDLDQVESAIKDALLALERSTAPKICLENLFLRLI